MLSFRYDFPRNRSRGPLAPHIHPLVVQLTPVKRADFDRWLSDPARRPLVMGVLNVTPDSFSDGGLYADLDRAVAHAREMAQQGADLLDVGGESTRPGAAPVDAAEQVRRVAPVIRAIRRETEVAISVDTTRSAVAEAAADAGAAIVNDISAGRDDESLLPLAARLGLAVVLMHMQGTPRTMQEQPHYDDVVAEVRQFLEQRMQAAVACGVPQEKVLLDPGIGFGKTTEHNLVLLRHIDVMRSLGRPLLVGTSRKRFIGTITGQSEPSRRLYGTAATVAWSVARGADIVRVHDVAPMAQVVRMIQAISSAGRDATA
jgi:dihydropteroate synthase